MWWNKKKPKEIQEEKIEVVDFSKIAAKERLESIATYIEDRFDLYAAQLQNEYDEKSIDETPIVLRMGDRLKVEIKDNLYKCFYVPDLDKTISILLYGSSKVQESTGEIYARKNKEGIWQFPNLSDIEINKSNRFFSPYPPRSLGYGTEKYPSPITIQMDIKFPKIPRPGIIKIENHTELYCRAEHVESFYNDICKALGTH